MGEISDLNITKAESGKFSSNLGTAHEHLVTGILMRLGFDVSVSSVKGEAYDLLITAYETGPGSKEHIIKAQVKTARKSIGFVGGVRAGRDRAYKSTEKKLVDKSYKYTEKHSDLIIGVDVESMDLYLIPTRIIKRFGKSKSLSKLALLKNYWNLLLNWSEDHLKTLEKRVIKAS